MSILLPESGDYLNTFHVASDSTEKITDYSSIPRSQVKPEDTWKISDIYPDHAAWQQEKADAEDMLKNAGSLKENWCSNAKNMYNLLKTYDDIRMKLSRLYIYSSLNWDSDMNVQKYKEMQGEIHLLFVKLNSLGSFMKPDIVKLGREKIDSFVKQEHGLKDYELKFDVIFSLKDHILGEESEDILSLTGIYSNGPMETSEIFRDIEMPNPEVTLSDDTRVKLNNINYTRYRYSGVREDRQKVMEAFWNNHARFRNTLASLLDCSVKHEFFCMKARKYPSCLKQALAPKKISAAVYTNLIETVRNNLSPLHDYLQLKKKILDLDSMSYADLYASCTPSIEKTYSIDTAKTMVVNAMKVLGGEYTGLLEHAFSSRWMDVYPNRGKRTGAYSNGSAWGVHPYVLMNFNNTFHSVMTLAHEFGHALHSWFSNHNNPYPKARYPIFLAEIASTFNEMILINHVIQNERDKNLKLFLLGQQLESFRTTLVRQTLFAEFELAMHSHVENGRTLTPDWLDEKYLELVKFYYGHDKGIIEVQDYIKNEWSFIPHFYYNFYVFQYATGLSAASSLALKVLNGGEQERDQYMDFLKSGGKDYPIETLKKASVDLETPEPVEDAMKLVKFLTGQMNELIHP